MKKSICFIEGVYFRLKGFVKFYLFLNRLLVDFYTNLSRKCDFRRFYFMAVFSPAIERLTLAGETPALHSEVQKQDTIGIKAISYEKKQQFDM